MYSVRGAPSKTLVQDPVRIGIRSRLTQVRQRYRWSHTISHAIPQAASQNSIRTELYLKYRITGFGPPSLNGFNGGNAAAIIRATVYRTPMATASFATR